MKIIGHRGARGLAPENTIASFQKALEYGVDEVELDVRVTKDSVAIVIHDPHLTDPAGTELRITDYTYTELKDHKADLPTLGEAMTAINRQVPVLIEVKPEVSTKPVIKVIQQLLADKWEPSDMLLGSFDQKTLRELHAALPDIEKVVIEPWSGIRAVRRARQVNAQRLNMNKLWLWRGFLKPMHKRGWQIYPYTLNDVQKAKRWASYGIAGVITDYPDRFEKN